MAHEFARRLVHAAGTLIPVSYLLGRPPLLLSVPVVGRVPWSWVVWFVLGGTAVAAVLEGLRLSGWLELRLYDVLTREYEQDNPAGYALYAVGMAVVVMVFAPAIAVPAMLMLTVGDPISGVLGRVSSAEGMKAPATLAVMFAVCLAVSVPFVALPAAVLGAIAATVADGVKPVVAGYVVDDNFTIPIGGAVAMWFGAHYLPAIGGGAFVPLPM